MGVQVDVMADPEVSPEAQAKLSALAHDVVETVLRLEGYQGENAEVSVLYTDDKFISELNLRYRGVEGPTDVLSFALKEDEDQDGEAPPEDMPDALGDIVVSLETAAKQAEAEHKTLEQEVALLLAHATLHLLGYDHDEPEKEAVMWKRQGEVLKELGLA